ncbi:hypothetical protein L596_002492 [Steinernema carpocapsae]|uniref:Uncharacterized protein n=1 Tax=Steinernema carpocapsae TaxID=34508 RepID=A0A4U8UR76_STECR|nr:hypothetical protein L596_002492 [Steinernema carpocapsae]
MCVSSLTSVALGSDGYTEHLVTRIVPLRTFRIRMTGTVQESRTAYRFIDYSLLLTSFSRAGVCAATDGGLILYALHSRVIQVACWRAALLRLASLAAPASSSPARPTRIHGDANPGRFTGNRCSRRLPETEVAP